jgi:cell division protein FtsA
MEASEHAVREAVELAERMSAVTVDEVWASFGANGLVSDVANVEVELGGHQIEQADIEELLSAGKRAIDRGGQVVLHAHPALYTIDRAQGVQQPIGLFAAALACLSEEERELGVALVELGAEVTNVSVHYGGMLVGLRSIEIGARDITNDIAGTFGVQRRDAERLKCFYGSAMTSPRDNHEMIEASQMGTEQGAEPTRITRAQLMMVIRQRVEELTNEIESSLKALGFTGPVGRQVVLTGGGAELKNIADYMQGVLGRAVRIGRPKTLMGMPEAHSGPGFSTLVGLAMLASSGSGDIRDIAVRSVAERKPGKGVVGKLIAAMRGGF